MHRMIRPVLCFALSIFAALSISGRVMADTDVPLKSPPPASKAQKLPPSAPVPTPAPGALSELTRERDEARERAGAATRAAEGLEQRIKALEREVESLRREAREAREDGEALRKRLEEVEVKRAALEKSTKEQESARDALEQQARLAAERDVALRRELEEKAAEIAALKMDVERVRGEHGQAIAQRESVKARLADVEQALARKSEEAGKAASALEALQAKRDKPEKALREREKELKAAQAAVESSARTLADAQQRVDALSSSLASETAARAKAEEEAEGLRERLAELGAELARAKDQRDALEKAAGKQEAEVRRLTALLDEERSRAKASDRGLANATETLQRMEKERKTAESRSDERVKALEKELASLRAEQASVQEARNAAEGASRRAAEQIETLTSQHAAASKAWGSEKEKLLAEQERQAALVRREQAARAKADEERARAVQRLNDASWVREGRPLRTRWEDVNDPELVWSLNDVALLAIQERHYDPAETLLQRALSIAQATQPGGHPVEGALLVHLAAVAHGRSNHVLEASTYARAAELFLSQRGDASPLYAEALSLQAGALVEAGKREEAEALYRKAIAIYENQPRKQRHAASEPLRRLGMLLMAAQRLDEAGTVLLQAWRLLEHSKAASAEAKAMVCSTLSDWYRAVGKVEESAAFAERAAAFAPPARP